MQPIIRILVAILGLIALAGAETITLKDGTRHTGTLVGATAKTVSLREGSIVHRYLKSKIQSIDFDSEIPQPASGNKRLGSEAREATLPVGTEPP